jgi:hypothetical protein
MVSSIVPGTTGAGAHGVDGRYTRNAPGAQRREDVAQHADRVELTGAALAAARESVRAGIAQVQEGLALGHEAQAMLVKVQAAARAGAQSDVDAALAAFSLRVDAAIARGTRLVAGEQVTVQPEPGGAPVAIDGIDLRIKDEPTLADVISVSARARADSPALAQDAQRSLEKLQDAMGRLLEAVRALEAHQGFLDAAEGATAVRADLDADTARLMALQVRQGLQAAGADAIANVEPQAVLALFKA